MCLGLQDLDPDPLVRGSDPFPSLFEDNVPVGKLKEKNMEYFLFCNFKVTEERSRIRSWIRIH
jgi:hypothetical protein